VALERHDGEPDHVGAPGGDERGDRFGHPALHQHQVGDSHRVMLVEVARE
jgi:hypothetical protein